MGEEHDSHGHFDSEPNRPQRDDNFDIYQQFFDTHLPPELRAYLSGDDVNESSLQPSPEHENVEELIEGALDEIFPTADDFFITEEPLPAHEQLSFSELLEHDPHEALRALLVRIGEFLDIEVTEFTIPIGELLIHEFKKSSRTLERRIKHPKLQLELEAAFLKICQRLEEPAQERKSKERKLTKSDVIADVQTYKDFSRELKQFSETYDVHKIPLPLAELLHTLYNQLDLYLALVNEIIEFQDELSRNPIPSRRRELKLKTRLAHDEVSKLIPVMQKDIDHLLQGVELFVEQQILLGKRRGEFWAKPQPENPLYRRLQALFTKIRNIFQGKQ